MLAINVIQKQIRARKRAEKHSVTIQNEAAEAAWREAAEKRYAELLAGGVGGFSARMIEDERRYTERGPGAASARARELQALHDWQIAWGQGKDAPRGAKTLAERRRKAALAELAMLPKHIANRDKTKRKAGRTDTLATQKPAAAHTDSVTTQNENAAANTDSVPTQKKRGRPPLHGEAMSNQKRSQEARKRRKERAQDDARNLRHAKDAIIQVAAALAKHDLDAATRRLFYAIGYLGLDVPEVAAVAPQTRRDGTP